MSDAAAVFDPLRPALVRAAYRMLGSMADAEDVVQEAFIRWMGTDRAAVTRPEGYLRQVVTRLCLDQLKSARRRRETYIGPWLPEPVVEDSEEEADDVTLPLLMALERLSPLERAAFLLHDVFGAPFEEVAETLGRDPAACRQLASRARTHVRQARPRFTVPKEKGMEIASAFFAATRNGDMAGLQAILAADVALHADGGGKRPAAFRALIGRDEVLGLHGSLARQAGGHIPFGHRPLRPDQRPARLRLPRARRASADHGPAHRGRRHQGHLYRAQSRQADAAGGRLGALTLPWAR